ncbi:MAG TPA: hypothetical protein VMO26_20835 [Vicinamibacterales bacterium]|nr:hypothetical protein [Vicinamibacterales bacterium]
MLQDALDVRDRVAAGEISAHGAAVARGRLMSRLLDLTTALPDDNQRFVNALAEILGRGEDRPI